MGARLYIIIAVAIVASIAIASAVSSVTNLNIDDNDDVKPVDVISPTISNDTLIDDNNPIDTLIQTPPAGQIIEISNRAHLAELLSESSPFSNQYWPQPMFRNVDQAPMMVINDASDSVAESSAVMSDSATTSKSGLDYSTTNVQVGGVDEPDYIKNDGQYVYIVTGNTLIIADVWPASEMHVKTKVALDIGQNHIRDIFLNGDDLVLFYSSQSDDLVIREYEFAPQRSYKPVTHTVIIDISNRDSPAIYADYSIDGWFEDARMIDDHVYVVTTSRLDYDYPEFPIIVFDDQQRMTPQAFYFDDESQFSTFTTLVSVDLSNDYSLSSETFLMGDTGTYYVTPSNFYLTYLQSLPPGYNYERAAHERFFKVIVPLLPENIQNAIMNIQQFQWIEGSKKSWIQISEILQNYYNSLDSDQRDTLFLRIEQALVSYDTDIMRDRTRTVIHKVSIDESEIDYQARGSVPGRLLNQFSLGESDRGERLRVATTLEYHTEFGGFERSNSVYTLDENLDLVGALEEIAPDESIYSVRFMDDRLYMVTFQQIDPFFVIDISDDTPRILGELKIPGFSNYLHPFDDNHVIGIGRDTKLVDGRWVQPLGVKIALFNVADVSNPIVADDIIIGTSDTYSDALGDHKAFFFDSRQAMISIPIEGSFATLQDTLKQSEINNVFDFDVFPGDYWSGFYVLDIDTIRGIDIRNVISHSAISNNLYGDEVTSPRTFYIDNVLYTVSNSVIIASDIDTIEHLGSVKLTGTGLIIDYLN